MRGEAFIPAHYDVFAGLDVDKRSISVTFTDHQRLIRSMRIPYSVEHLLNYVRKHFADQKIAFVYEAGPTGYGLYDGLVAQAYPCLVAAPSMIPKAPGQRVKTNRLDSQALSEHLRGGQLKSIHVPSQPYRELRHLTQLRETFVRQVVGHEASHQIAFAFRRDRLSPSSSGWPVVFHGEAQAERIPLL